MTDTAVDEATANPPASLYVGPGWCGEREHHPPHDSCRGYGAGYRAATPPEPAGLREAVWLIERGQPERQVPTVWWTGHDWTEDPNKATRFASREDAEDRIARTFTPPPSRGGPSARAIEHIWLDTSYHRRRVARRCGPVRAALAAAPKVESVRAASERLGIPIGHVRDYPHRFAPFEDDGLVQRAHVACCWCGEHHEEGR